MKLPALVTADLHLTASPRDEYRWALFPWLRKTCQEEGVKTLAILGDLTDAKDQHPAELVNRVVRELDQCAALVEHVVVTMGNHDYRKEGRAFFDFLSVMPRVHFASATYELAVDGGPPALFMPHVRDPETAWRGMDFSHYRYLFIHQTVSGATASNGQQMRGERLPQLKTAGKVYSGDIHVPQVIGDVEYVGSPYHVHFGDKFKPRVLLLDGRDRPVDLEFDATRRFVLQVSTERQLQRALRNCRPGDQVKLRVVLEEAEKHDWLRVKRRMVEMLEEARVEAAGGVEMRLDRAQLRLEVPVPQGRATAEVARLDDEEAVLRMVERDELGGEALEAALNIIEGK